MKPRDVASEDVRKEFHELWQCLGGHLHQDWADDYATWERAIDAAVAELPRGGAKIVLDQLERVLALHLPAADLADVLSKLGCYYWPGRKEAYDPWLREVADRIRESSPTDAIY